MFRRATFAMLVSLLTAAATQKKPSTPATKSQDRRRLSIHLAPPVFLGSESCSPRNGIGYFEHAARVRGIHDLAIDFTTSDAQVRPICIEEVSRETRGLRTRNCELGAEN